ncbi:MAG: ATP-dependent protease ATPase subunit HslU [Alphaproteobacteria bacterium]|nr:ATP-dependent protease ATPase subunit HslU [Alphaproteobacteria bacterium]
MSMNMSPREIVSELDRYIVGQNDAKRSVAIALRNRWRRQQTALEIRDEIQPKNILMVGPTGCGKTEIARRLAKLTRAPFIKIEATKFTEVGYVGRDVEQIVRDLVEAAIKLETQRHLELYEVEIEQRVEERVIDALVGKDASEGTRQSFRCRLRTGELDQQEISLEVMDSKAFNMPQMDIPGMPGAQMGMIDLSEMMGKAMGHKPKKLRKMSIAESHRILFDEEKGAILDHERIVAAAIDNTEQNGIVFLDEIDKISARENSRGSDISREGVQRDLLPLIEGTTVATKHGSVKTDYILFIASGAFHQSKPADLLPELQGRLPIRVSLDPLTSTDFRRILKEPENSLLKQYTALLAAEDYTLDFDDDAIERLAILASEINNKVENIGARRLHTLMETLLEDISYLASEQSGMHTTIDAAFVDDKLKNLAESTDLSKFIL